MNRVVGEFTWNLRLCRCTGDPLHRFSYSLNNVTLFVSWYREFIPGNSCLLLLLKAAGVCLFFNLAKTKQNNKPEQLKQASKETKEQQRAIKLKGSAELVMYILLGASLSATAGVLLDRLLVGGVLAAQSSRALINSRASSVYTGGDVRRFNPR